MYGVKRSAEDKALPVRQSANSTNLSKRTITRKKEDHSKTHQVRVLKRFEKEMEGQKTLAQKTLKDTPKSHQNSMQNKKKDTLKCR